MHSKQMGIGISLGPINTAQDAVGFPSLSGHAAGLYSTCCPGGLPGSL